MHLKCIICKNRTGSCIKTSIELFIPLLYNLICAAGFGKGIVMQIRIMTIDDYEAVHALWMTIRGFAIRSVDDSREGVERFLMRNPTTSVVAVEEGKIVGLF